MTDVEYDIAIIGAGLGGLATASMLAQKGKRVIVLDKHAKPGGYASFFKRGDFTFDTSCHSINGITEDFNTLLDDCALNGLVEFIDHKKLYRVVSDEYDLSVYSGNLESYKQKLTDLFPEEGQNIHRLFEEARKMQREVVELLYSRKQFIFKLALTPILYPRVLKYDRYTVDQFFSQFTNNQKLKTLLSAQWGYYGLPSEELSYLYFSSPFMDYLEFGGSIVKGGSQNLADALVTVVQNYGGDVLLSSRVTKIFTEKGKIHSIDVKNKGIIRVGSVISNISPYGMTSLLEDNVLPRKFTKKLENMTVSTSAIQVFLGLDCTISDLGLDENEYSIVVTSKSPQAQQFREMMAGNFKGDTDFIITLWSNIDNSMAPEGKSTIGLFSLAGGADWDGITKKDYRIKKENLKQLMLAKAERVIPNLSKHIEVCEVATPRTMKNYTYNTKGSIYGFAQTVKQAGLFRRFPQKYPIKGLYQVGAWTFPGGGYTGTMASARVLVDRYFGGIPAKTSSTKPKKKLVAEVS